MSIINHSFLFALAISITGMGCASINGLIDQASPNDEANATITQSYLKPDTVSAEGAPADAQTADQNLIPDEEFYLFSPIRSTETYLMNDHGEAVYTWSSRYQTGQTVYMLENGNLLRTGILKTGVFDGSGAGGLMQEIAPDNSIVWEYQFADEQVQQHHDIEQLPNGNILMIAWEYKTEAEAITAGRDPDLIKDDELWPDHIIEVDPTTNQIVWKWHIWDHLVQDNDPDKENYGVVADHPELINLNFFDKRTDWVNWQHSNAIDYNAELDQIMLSVRNFSEIWIIDHNTTTEEAAGQAGDLLYRWGNPQAYDAGTEADQQLFLQHDAEWILSGYPGEGNILVFNNGDNRSRPYSSIDEIVTPLNADGSYTLTAAPAAPAWTYIAEDPADFFSIHISSAQRLSNGNTLICRGVEGIFFEVTPDGDIVWSYEYGGAVFRVTQISSDHPGVVGLELQPGETLKDNTQDTQEPQSNNGPPQAPVDACSSLTEGDACAIQNPNRTVSGSCENIQNQLVCRPEGNSPPQRP
jgi:hypothetical protein